jgi:2',3'-cyclic-nucleotide 2'-phosphodiesterase (5'-nucleotidase family)
MTNFRNLPFYMRRFLLSALFPLLLTACSTGSSLSGIKYKGYPVNPTRSVDTALLQLVRPYRDSVGKTMDEVLVQNQQELLKELPDSPLGNFLADAYLWAARTKFDAQADIAFMNHGGVRVNRFAAGPITRGMVFEVMPFDNQLVIVPVKGEVLQQYVQRLAAEGGGGGVAGLSYRIEGKQAVDIRVQDKPMDVAATYNMVNSDYAVDGGGGFRAFRELKQNRTGYLQRDAIIAYCQWHQQEGRKITTTTNTRISK